MACSRRRMAPFAPRLIPSVSRTHSNAAHSRSTIKEATSGISGGGVGSRDLHRGLVTPPRTVEAFERYLARLRGPAHIGYWIRTSEDELAGVITISEIVRGAFQSAYLGYHAFVPHNGHGRMSQGFGRSSAKCFESIGCIGSKQHSTRQYGFARISSWTRIPARRLFATVPQGWWSLA